MSQQYQIVKINPNSLVEHVGTSVFPSNILALCANNNNLYVGLGNQLINLTTGQVCATHSKSIRTISASCNFVVCGSYDGNGTILSADDTFIDKIEGVLTEIKGIAICDEMIAIATRGRSVWILEQLEVSKILDDHIQDVKGCAFYNNKLFTWSYDQTIKIYEQFIIDNSWELIQSIDLCDTIWDVKFMDERIYAVLQNGFIVLLELSGCLFYETKRTEISAYPVRCISIVNNMIITICNRNCIAVLNDNLELINETDSINEYGDIFAMIYFESDKSIVCGGEDGYIYKVSIAGLN